MNGVFIKQMREQMEKKKKEEDGYDVEKRREEPMDFEALIAFAKNKENSNRRVMNELREYLSVTYKSV
jgi:hypothetical protein